MPLVIAMQLPGTEGVKRAVEGGLGVGMVSRYAVESECATGVLRQVPVEGFRLARSMNLVSRAQKYFSPVALRFREFAKSYGAERLDRLPAPSTDPAGSRRSLDRAPESRRPSSGRRSRGDLGRRRRDSRPLAGGS